MPCANNRLFSAIRLHSLWVFSAFCLLSVLAGCSHQEVKPTRKPTLKPPAFHQDSFTNSLGMKFVYIPPGTFTMGSPDDEPGRQGGETPHEVTLTRGFYIMTTEVTQQQWNLVMHDFPSWFADCGLDCPVENISWNDIQEFIRKLNKMEGTERYRLPTEAEWEYACRAGTKGPFYTGQCLRSEDANYDARYPAKDCPEGGYLGRTVPVKSHPPNAWGLYDMYGNVLEACQDWYEEFIEDPVTDPVGPESGRRRVYRGGSWSNDAKDCRSASRSRYFPDQWSSLRGFRLAADPPEGSPPLHQPAAAAKPSKKSKDTKAKP